MPLPTDYFIVLNEWGYYKFPGLFGNPQAILYISMGILLLFATFSAFGGLMILRGIHLTIYKKRKR